ncbi:LCP family protein [uncultured Flavonifractor sp.]|uniref:LCP family protein n=1 Tax=uncultured Flavonifractor sp. TaxID=1193534 RepID=UPI0026059CC8|nr:LCP family protein [uncultured Flavonifractor sp.]
MNPEHRNSTQGGARLEKKESASRPSGRKKRSRPHLTRKQKILRILFIVLTVIAAIIVAAAIIYKLLVVKPEEPGVTPPPTESGAVEYDFGEGPRLYGDRKDEFYTFLLIGRDTGGGGNTDTLMVVAYDVKNQELNAMSIPRDTMVNVPWDLKRINSVYNYAPYYDKDGIEFLREEVSYLVGFQPDYTIVVEWEAVGELVDAIGGVYFDVPIDMDYEDPTQDLYIHLDAGPQDINGDEAMQLLRWRKNNKMVNGQNVIYGGYPNGDLGRIETQQAFLKAVIEKCLNSISLNTIPKLVNIFMENVETSENLTVNNLAWFAQEAIVGGLSMDNVNFMTMPNKGVYVYSRTYKDDQSYVVPIQDELLELVNTYLNPYLEDIKLEELDLMSVNSDGTLSSTRGVVEDTKANSGGSSRPSSTPKPAVTETPAPSETPVASPEISAAPSQSPEASASAQPSSSPAASGEPGQSPAATPTPEVPPTATPVFTPDPVPTPVPTPAATPGGNIEYGPGMEPVA